MAPDLCYAGTERDVSSDLTCTQGACGDCGSRSAGHGLRVKYSCAASQVLAGAWQESAADLELRAVDGDGPPGQDSGKDSFYGKYLYLFQCRLDSSDSADGREDSHRSPVLRLGAVPRCGSGAVRGDDMELHSLHCF